MNSGDGKNQNRGRDRSKRRDIYWDYSSLYLSNFAAGKAEIVQNAKYVTLSHTYDTIYACAETIKIIFVC